VAPGDFISWSFFVSQKMGLLESITQQAQDIFHFLEELWNRPTATINVPAQELINQVPWWQKLIQFLVSKPVSIAASVIADILARPSYTIMTQSEEAINYAIHLFDWLRYGVSSSAIDVQEFAQQVANNLWLGLTQQAAAPITTAQQVGHTIQTTIPVQTSNVLQTVQQATQQVQQTVTGIAQAAISTGIQAAAHASSLIQSTASNVQTYVAGNLETIQEQLFDQSNLVLQYSGEVTSTPVSFLGTISTILGVISQIAQLWSYFQNAQLAQQQIQQAQQQINALQQGLGAIASVISSLPSLFSGTIAFPIVQGLQNVIHAISNLSNTLTGAINAQTQSIVQTQAQAAQAISESIATQTQALVQTQAAVGEAITSTLGAQTQSLVNAQVATAEAIAGTIAKASAATSLTLASAAQAIVDAINTQTVSQIAIARGFESEVNRVLSQAAESINVQLKDLTINIEKVNSDIAKAIREHYGKVDELVSPITQTVETLSSEESSRFAAQAVNLISEAKQDAPQLAAFVESIVGMIPILQGLTGILMVRDVFVELKQTVWGPVMEKIRQKISARVREGLIPDSAILEALQRGIITQQVAHQLMARKGYEDAQIDILVKLTETLLSAETLSSLFLRGILSEQQYYDRMKILGYGKDTATLFIEARKSLLDAKTVIHLYLAGKINEEEAKKRIKALGFREEDFNLILASSISYASVGEIISSWRRGIISEETAKRMLRIYNLDDTSIRMLMELAKPMPGIGDLQDAFFREIISEQELDGYLKRLGWDTKEINLLKKLMWRIPPVQDIIRFAVRECFTPEIAEKFGQYQDIPREYIEWAKKSGLSEFWAKAYWAAHWELPSITMGFEMFHREVISKEELMLLLRAQDVMPFWREKLLQISYTPLTRVDLRRIWELGLIDENELERRLRHIGYSPDDAKLMVEYYKVEKRYARLAQQAEGLELVKNEVLKGYSVGAISRTEAIDRLVKLNYDPEEAELLIAIEDLKKETARKERAINAVKKAYISGKITYEDLVVKLSSLGIGGKELKEHLDDAQAGRTEKVRELSKEDILSAMKHGIIDENKALERLTSLGYSQNDAKILIALEKAKRR
jgi:hypothetical protein